MRTQSGQRQCPSDLILCEVTVSQIQARHREKKTRAENLTKKLVLFSAIMGEAIRESSVGARLGKSSKVGMFVSKPRQRTIIVCVRERGRYQIARKKQNLVPKWKVLMK